MTSWAGAIDPDGQPAWGESRFYVWVGFYFFHMLKNVETLESNNPDPLKEKLNATTITGRGRSAPGWLERRTSTPSRPSCWRGMKLTPSVTLELQQQQVSFTMHSLCVHFMSFYLKLASEPPYGGCLTSHNAQDPDLFKLSRNYCQYNTIRLSLTINLLAISAVYRHGCRYLKIQFQKHYGYRFLKITLHGNLSLSSIQKWTDAFISFRFVLIWLLHNKNSLSPSEILSLYYK